MNSPLISSRWEGLKWFFHMAFGIAFAIVPIGFSTGRIREAFSTDSLELFPLPQLSIVLLFMTIMLILGWFKAVAGEMEMLRTYAEDFAPVLPRSTSHVAIALAVTLGLLAFFSDRTLVYSSLFVCYKISEVWAIWIRDSKIEEGLKTARELSSSEDKRRQAWDVIENYYMNRPQIPLAVTELSLMVVAIVLSIYGEVLQPSLLAKLLSTSAYLVIILTLITNSVVYTIWRRERDRALGERFV